MEVIRQNDEMQLYRDGVDCYIRIFSRHPQKTDDVVLQIDSDKAVIGMIEHFFDRKMSLYCSASSHCSVFDSRSLYCGKLSHYIMSARKQMPLDEVQQRYKKMRFLTNNTYDYRESNLYSTNVDSTHRRAGKSIKVRRIGNDLVIIYKPESKIPKQATVFVTDYSPEMEQLLLSTFIHCFTRKDGTRLAAGIRNGEKSFIYHIRLALHLYGIPTNKAGFIETMQRFRDEYINKGLSVDHLDGDTFNNRLENLFIMRQGDNATKATFTGQIPAPYFWRSKRYNDTSIEVYAGYNSTPISEQCTLSGIFNVEEYMDRLRDFVIWINETDSICEYFNTNDLENAI